MTAGFGGSFGVSMRLGEESEGLQDDEQPS